jgi:hypothetical protein
MAFQSSAHFDSTALLIVKDEISNIIKSVEVSVNQLLEDNALPFGMDDVLTNLDQAAQVLALIEQADLSQLTRLLADLVRKSIDDFQQATIQDTDVQLMSEGMTTLLYYLDFLCIQESTAAQLLLPILNRLQIALQHPVTREGAMISPFLDTIDAHIDLPQPSALPASDWILPLYKVSLLHLLQQQATALDYQALSHCGHYFASQAQNWSSAQFWRLVDQALQHSEQIEITEPRLRSLILIASLAQQFLTAPADFQVDVDDLADVVCLCLSSDTLVAEQLRSKLQLMDEVLSDSQLQCLRRQLFGLDLDTVHTVADLLNSQIAELIQVMELGDYVHDHARQQQIAQQLQQLSNVFTVLNLNDVAQQLQQQALQMQDFDRLTAAHQTDNLAHSLLLASNALQILEHQYTPKRAKLALHNHQIILETVEDAQQALCHEARLSIQKLADLLLNFSNNPQVTLLEAAPDLLREISGGLLFLECQPGYEMLQKTAALLDRCLASPQYPLHSNAVPLLANTIASADFHFEQIQNHQPFMPKSIEIGYASVLQLERAIH